MYAPFRQGARTPYGIDDIGLIQQAYRISGYALARNLKLLAAAGDPVSNMADPRPGDLMLWQCDGEIKAGITIGDQQAVVVTDSVKIVVVNDRGTFDELEGGNLMGVRRVLKM